MCSVSWLRSHTIYQWDLSQHTKHIQDTIATHKSKLSNYYTFYLTLICPYIANVFVEYNQQDATFLNLFISVRRSACLRQFFCPSSGAQNCTYSVRYLSDQNLMLYVQFWAPGEGRKNRLKHVERLTEINKSWNAASCWLCSANIITTHFVKTQYSVLSYIQILYMLYVLKFTDRTQFGLYMISKLSKGHYQTRCHTHIPHVLDILQQFLVFFF